MPRRRPGAKSTPPILQPENEIKRKDRSTTHDRNRAPNWETEWVDDSASLHTARRKNPGEQAETVDGLVLGSTGRAVIIEIGGQQVRAVRASGVHLVVGDRVRVRERDDGVWWIDEIYERRTHLSRPDPHNPRERRIMAANIDIAVHVSSVKNPPFRIALVDRFLVAIRHGGTVPVLCVNKVELLDGQERQHLETQLADFQELGVAVILCSTKTGEGIEALRDALRQKTAVFAGHSGVGKSSLINALYPTAAARIGAVQNRSGRGRHTTTSAAMYDLGEGTRLIDTPGIREFGLWDIDPGELRFYFTEFEPYSLECRFSDCTHLHEPRCAVKEAVERGDLRQARHDAYRRLVEESAMNP